jgi:hypothetical protein
MGQLYYYLIFFETFFCSDKRLASYIPDEHSHAHAIHMKSALFLSNFKQNWNVSTNVIELSNMKFDKNPIWSAFLELLHVYKCMDKHGHHIFT